jgi:Omp85 superfamily domain
VGTFEKGSILKLSHFRLAHRGLASWFWALPLSVALSWAPEARAHQRSDLEKSLIAQALGELDRAEDTSPEGKVVDAIHVYTVDVFDARDPIPDWFNIFHTTTHERIVRREVLIRVGEAFDVAKVEETERNLRAIRQVSLANVVALRGREPGHVELLVLTKDVWSLRLNTDFAYGSTGLERLLLNLSEENLAGTHTMVGVVYQYERYRQSGGLRFVAPRVGGSRFRTAAEVRVFVNSETGSAEGSTGAFNYALPLYSRYARWGLSTSLEWLITKTRVLRRNELAIVPVRVGDRTEEVPWRYDEQRLLGEVSAIRSFGINRKWNFRAGVELDARRYRADDLAADPSLQEAFQNSSYVPISDVQLRPFLGMTLTEAKFMRAVSMDSLGLQEDIRKGYNVGLTTWFASRDFGSTRDILGVSAALGYTQPVRDGFLMAQASHTIALGNDGKHDASAGAEMRFASPWLAVGRVHVDAILFSRYQNYRRLAPFFLGGNSRLRGYPSSYFGGQNQLSLNVEFRTGSVDILSAQVGLAAFYDTGDTTDDFRLLSMHHSVGAGVRVLFPQANRQVLRVDWGFPLADAEVPTWPGGFFLTFGQAF